MHITLRLLSSYALLIYSVSALATRNTRVECEDNGLCFVQTPIKGSLSQIGFAFPPPATNTPPEMLVSMQVELPYGFAAFVPAHGSAASSQPTSSGQCGICGVLISIFPADAIAQMKDPKFLASLTPKDWVVQVSELLPNQTFAPTGAGSITLSPDIFFVNTSFYRIITRFQGAAMQELGVSSTRANEMSFLTSEILPTYITADDGDTPPAALFNASPATTSSFDFKFDGRQARFENCIIVSASYDCTAHAFAYLWLVYGSM